MKTKISISMNEETIAEIESRLSEGIFRNKSHFIEWAAKKCLRDLK